MCPFEVVKCRLQFQKKNTTYRGPLHCAAEIARTEGVSRGLFGGLRALYWRDVPFNFIFFGVYESCVHLCLRAHPEARGRGELHPLLIWLSGGIAGSLGWGVVYPMDVVKSTLQIATQQQQSATATTNAPTSVPSQMLAMLRQQGPRAFFAGWVPCVVRSFPANGALFLTYELVMRLLS